MQISVKTNFPDVQRKLNALQQDVRAKATASAVNKTMEQARTQMIREITGEYAVKAGFVRERLRISRANFKQGAFTVEASLSGTGKRAANMIAFVEKSVSFAQAKKRSKLGTLTQLHFQVRKSGAKKTIKGAFIGNKGRTVFVRTGKERLPIKAVTTINVPQMFNQKRINAAVIAAIKARFPTIFEREANFYVARFNSKA